MVPLHVKFTVTITIASCVLFCNELVTGLSTPMPDSLVSNIRNAMMLTSRSQTNITAAYEALSLWPSITSTATGMQNQLPNDIQAICLTLHASSLARVGQDEASVAIFEQALQLSMYLSKDASRDAKMKRGHALQRLMRYEEARMQFLDCFNSEDAMDEHLQEAVYSAALCSLRMGEMGGAQDILQSSFSATEINNGKDGQENASGSKIGNLAGMLGTVMLLNALQTSTMQQQSLSMLEFASRSKHATLYKWLYAVAAQFLSKKKSHVALNLNHHEYLNNELFLDLVAINNSPFDCSSLVHLDDKILLHELMTDEEANEPFWPIGFVLPNEMESFKRFIDSTEIGSTNKEEWILKDRAGYGSHGNRIVSTKEVLEMDTDILHDKPKEDNDDQQGEKAVLCQHMVNPPLLIRGCKFSLRVYVIYFPKDDSLAGCSDDSVYLSTVGLVKLASSLFSDVDGGNHCEDTDYTDSMHMTNSGREEGDTMTQFDFDFLRDEFDRQGLHYDRFWAQIQKSVKTVMKRYLQRKKKGRSVKETRRSITASIPKIMGFDYLIDSSCQAWLIEVNRFPGLEPRGECDASVKQLVVENAWRAASDRVNIPLNVIGWNDSQKKPVPSILEKIHI